MSTTHTSHQPLNPQKNTQNFYSSVDSFLVSSGGSRSDTMGFGKQGKGAIIRQRTAVALGALAADNVKIFSTPEISEDFRILKTEVFCTITGLTAGEGNGLILGMANGELTEAEVEACVTQALGPVDRNDRVACEIAERFCKEFGSTIDNAVSNDLTQEVVGPDGSPLMKVKPRWTFSDPEGWDFFIHNNGVLLTTGSTARLVAVHYGVWVS